MAGISRQTWLSLGLLVGLALLYLWRVVFLGDVLLSADMLLAYEPWRSELPGAEAVPLWNEKTADPLRDIYGVTLYIKESWRQGQIPFWYPYAGLGLPILARGMNQVLYPPNNLLWQLMDVPAALSWSAVVHLVLASCLAFAYARELGVGHFGSLVTAIAFAYSSHVMLWLGLPFIFDTMVWLPLVFWGLERAIARQQWQWAVVGGVGVALQILAGSLQLTSYGLTALSSYALGRASFGNSHEQPSPPAPLPGGEGGWGARLFSPLSQRERGAGGVRVHHRLAPLLYALLIAGVGCALAAPQILATLELVASGITRTGVEVNTALPLRNLARLLIPDINGTPVDGHNMSSVEFESYLYLGVLPLFFIAAGLFSDRAGRVRLLFGIGLLFLLVIYHVPPFYQLFALLYPAFGTLGFYRSLYVILFLWAVAAGLGADWLSRRRPEVVFRRLLWGGLGAGAVVLAGAVWLAFITKYQGRHFWALPAPPEAVPSLTYLLSTLLLFFCLFGAALWLLWQAARRPAPFFEGFSLLLLTLDLFLAHLDFTPALPPAMLTVSPPSLTFLRELAAQEPAPFRLSGVGNVLRPDTAGPYRLPAAQIHSSYLSQRLSDYADLTGLRRGGTFRDVIFGPGTHPLLNALNVKYIYAHRADLTEGAWFSVIERLGAPAVRSEQPEAGQVAHWNIQGWTQPVLLSPANSTLSYEAVLPYPALLETAIAVDPQTPPPAPITFEVYATVPGEELTAPRFSARLEAVGDWQPVTVDLADFAGRPVLIALVTTSAGTTQGGWADPLVTDGTKFEPVYYGVNSIYKNKGFLPRAWLAPQVVEVSTPTEAATLLAAPDFDPAGTAVIEGRLAAPQNEGRLAAPQNEGRLAAPSPSLTSSFTIHHSSFSPPSPPPEFITYTPTYARLKAKSETAGLLVLADLYYPGWQAYVDGVEQPLYATNLTLRGVWVPAGRHTVEFIYAPLPFKIGLYISAGAAVLLLILLLRRRTG